MKKFKCVVVFVLVSIAVLSTRADDAKIVKPDPCATTRCIPASKTCVVFTNGSNPGETYYPKCIDCPALKCKGGCLEVKHDNQCPTCECPKVTLTKKEKY